MVKQVTGQQKIPEKQKATEKSREQSEAPPHLSTGKVKLKPHKVSQVAQDQTSNSSFSNSHFRQDLSQGRNLV
jgi:hypothetical protein